MKYVREYVQFAVWFVGLGYIVLWPLTAHDNDIARLGAALICGDEASGPLYLICNPPYALHLSPGLHLMGLLSAICVVLRLLLHQLRRPRRAHAVDATAPAIAVHIAAGLPRPPRPTRQEPSWRLRPVKPRKNFGLRGVPH